MFSLARCSVRSALLMACMAAAVLFSFVSCSDAAHEPMERSTVRIEKSGGGYVDYNVELAVTSAQQDQGLMHRTSMPENQGMLFVFKSVHRRAFWMKNTLIPLDMLFIAKDGTITQIHRNAQPLDETVIPSTHVVKAVLELNGGQSEKDGIQEGDRIVHPVFRNTLAQ